MAIVPTGRTLCPGCGLWQRVSSLANVGAGARLVLGIDPTRLLAAIQSVEGLYAKCTGTPSFRLEDFPNHTQSFDIVLKGVLYHRVAFQHLEALRGARKRAAP